MKRKGHHAPGVLQVIRAVGATSLLSACSSGGAHSTETVRRATNALLGGDASTSLPPSGAATGQGRPAIEATVLPNARCRVSATGTTAAPSATVNVGQEGVLRFFAPPASWGSELTVECTSSNGTHATYSVDLNAPSSFTLDSSYQKVAPVIGVRPALAGDALAVTAAELHARGYPPRPDPNAEPRQYAQWLEWVSKPLQIVDPIWISDLNVSGSLMQSQDEVINTLWTGPFMVNTGVSPQFYYWSGVSFFQAPGFFAPNSSYFSLVWSGIGGTASTLTSSETDRLADNAIIQAGLALTTGCPNNSAAIYTQYFPAAASISCAFPVTPGDTIVVETSDDDCNGNFPPTYFGVPVATCGNVWVADFSTGYTVHQIIHYDGTTITASHSFEYIVERPVCTNPCGPCGPLSDNADITMGGYAFDSPQLQTAHYIYNTAYSLRWGYGFATGASGCPWVQGQKPPPPANHGFGSQLYTMSLPGGDLRNANGSNVLFHELNLQ